MAPCLLTCRNAAGLLLQRAKPPYPASCEVPARACPAWSQAKQGLQQRMRCNAATHARALVAPLPRRRPSDDQLKWRQGLTLLLMRVLQADYVFPPDRQLRWGLVVLPGGCLPAGSLHLLRRGWLLPAAACSEGVRDLISRILVVDPDQRPTIQVGHLRSGVGTLRPTRSAACRSACAAAANIASVACWGLSHAHLCPIPAGVVLLSAAGHPAAPLVCGGPQTRGAELQRQHPAAVPGAPAAGGAAGRGAPHGAWLDMRMAGH